MKDSPLIKRAQRRARHQSMVDLPLVSLIDIFTILIFFLLANSGVVEMLPPTQSVRLPESTATQPARETVVVVVSDQDITVQGTKVADAAAVMQSDAPLIAPLKAELDLLASRQLIRTDRKDNAHRVVTIMGDKTISYRLLRKVMLTCAAARYSEMSFAVLQKGG